MSQQTPCTQFPDSQMVPSLPQEAPLVRRHLPVTTLHPYIGVTQSASEPQLVLHEASVPPPLTEQT